MSELGKCPRCRQSERGFFIYGHPEVLAQYSGTGQILHYHVYFTEQQESQVQCRFCGAVRPDLICREGRIEKREAKDG